ncbi:MAG: ArsR family transcriptional regulator, partial [Curvibacter sp.]
MDRPTTPLSEAARQRLRQGPQSARELMDAFEVSQPTVSRA